MPIVNIRSTCALSPEAMRGLTIGQQYWWIREEHGGFVDLSAAVLCSPPTWWRRLVDWMQGRPPAELLPADRTLDILVDLEPGRYVVGCGDRDRGIRIGLTVDWSTVARYEVPAGC